MHDRAHLHDAVEGEHLVRHGVRERLEKVERVTPHGLARGPDERPVVGGGRELVVADLDLDVQIDDEVLRSVSLAGLASEVARLRARFVIKDGDQADD